MMGTAFDADTISAIRDELRRVLASPDFDASKRNRAFLEYVVDESLLGRADRIKAYSIATLSFGRDEEFDPQTDPVVRFEARRLRRSLERYYLMSGKGNAIQITIPKGSYVPNFEFSPDEKSAAAPPAPFDNSPVQQTSKRRFGPAILILPFEAEGDHSNTMNLTRGFVRHLIVALTRFRELFVYGWETSLQLNPNLDLHTLRQELRVDYVVTGGVEVSADRFGVEIVLIDAQSGLNVWSATKERALLPVEIIRIRDEFAESVAQTLGQPYGIIQTRKATEIDGVPPRALASYACVVRYYQYARNFDPDEYECVRACLESTISEDTSYAEAFACLSQLYSDAYRFNFANSPTHINPRRRALDLAQQAVHLAPDSSSSYLALSRAYWFNDDVAASLAALETGQALNPNDSLIMAESGLRHAVLANWEKAEELLRTAYARNPALPGGFRVGLSLFHYAHGRFASALLEARKIDVPNFPYGHVLEAISLAALDRYNEAATIVKYLLARDKNFHKNLYADLERRHVDPGIIDFVADGLRRAGLRDIEQSVNERS